MIPIVGTANENESFAAPTIVLPWPPTGNLIWRHAGKRHYLSAEYKAYRTEVALLKIQRRVPSFTGRIAVELRCHAKDERSRDLDNVCKGLLDSLMKAGIIANDKFIDELHVRRMPIDRIRPRVEVWIRSLRGAA